MKRYLLLGITMLSVVGCANLAPVATPTGKPEVTINTTNTSRIKGALVSTLGENGYGLTQDTPYSLIFGKQLEGSGAVLYQVALGNAYSSPPQMNMAFTFAPAGQATRVFAHINISMQGVLGQNQGTNMDTGKAAHEVQAMLEQIKANVESHSG